MVGRATIKAGAMGGTGSSKTVILQCICMDPEKATVVQLFLAFRLG